MMIHRCTVIWKLVCFIFVGEEEENCWIVEWLILVLQHGELMVEGLLHRAALFIGQEASELFKEHR